MFIHFSHQKNAKVNIELKLCQLLPDMLTQKLSHTGGLTGGDSETRFKESDDSARHVYWG